MSATSRPKRWANAIAQAHDAIQTAHDDLEEAFEKLRELQTEYQDWLDGLPENLQGGPTEEKLQAVVDLDLDVDLDIFDDLESTLDDLEQAELPLGFGRD